MDRRDFIKRTTAAGLLLGAASCAPTLAALPKNPSPEDMDAYLARMDRARRAIEKIPLAGGLVADAKPGTSAAYAANDRLTRDALAALYMVGSFHDLDDHGRMHPGIQRRMRDAMPVMDRAVFGNASMLESLTPARLARVQDVLSASPEVLDKAQARIDSFGATTGISIPRRLDLRASIDELAGRLRVQNPALLIGEYVAKVRRVEAQSGIHAESERHLVARMGREAFTRHQSELQDKHLAWRERLKLGPIDGQAGNTTLSAGAITLGIGAAIEVTGLLCLAAGADGAWLVLGVTVGPIVLTIGLIVAIVGLAIGDDDE